MKTVLKTILLVLISITFYTCGSDDDTPVTTKSRLINYSRNATEYTFTYNEKGKLDSYKFGTGATINLIYDTNDRLIQKGNETYTYNSQGKINRITLPNNTYYSNNITNVIYNIQGKIAVLELSKKRLSTGVTEYETITMTYDSANKLLSVTEHDVQVNPRYIKNTLIYDTNGNAIQVISEKSSNGSTYTPNRVSTFTYDSKKNPYYDIIKSIGITEPISVIKIIPSLSYTIINGYNSEERIFFYSPNNKITSTTPSTYYNTSFESEFVYNAKNYPTAAERDRQTINVSTGVLTEDTLFYNWNYETY